LRIVYLSLTNFRNYQRLELDLPPHLTVLHGDNAQGKTNLLEAIYLLATARSHRATAERELLNWLLPDDGMLATRIAATVEKAKQTVQVEIALMATHRGRETVTTDLESSEARLLQKRIRVNGVPRRASDLVGQVNVVLFSSQDIDIISGPPALRRRYLDITNSQVSARYLRALQRYNRILAQRNHLLRLIGEHRAQTGELDFWDGELVEQGSCLIDIRQNMVAELDRLARPIHRELTTGREELVITYGSSVSLDEFTSSLQRMRDREVAYGMSLIGPHRDGLSFTSNSMDMGTYGSRGQQRTVALSLKLAEAVFIRSKTGDAPILLLDDVLSELDLMRRKHLLDFVASQQQVIITTTDLQCFAPSFLSEASLFQVKEGAITPVT